MVEFGFVQIPNGHRVPARQDKCVAWRDRVAIEYGYRHFVLGEDRAI